MRKPKAAHEVMPGDWEPTANEYDEKREKIRRLPRIKDKPREPEQLELPFGDTLGEYNEGESEVT
jgi:hypothetical protein